MSPEEAIAKAQAAFMTAMFAGDREACERLLLPDFSLVRPNTDHAIEVVLRDQWLDDLPARAAPQASVTDTVISTHGNVAVTTVLWVENPESSAPVRQSVTDVWHCAAEGGWLLAERHAWSSSDT